MSVDDSPSPATWLVSGGRPDAVGEPLNAPIVPASNFTIGDELVYSRDDGTPTWLALESVLGGLEGGDAVTFASGMGAAAAVFDLLPVGARVALPTDCYQGVVGVAADGAATGRWTVERLDLADTEAWIDAAGRCDLVWLESPSNPLLVVADVAAICAAPRRDGALLAVDNTFATPLNQRPLDLGADVSMQSVTKFIGGHSDLLGGVLVTRSSDLAARLRRRRTLAGATPGAIESYLATRGARTMALRVERSQQNAGILAERLAAHPAIEVVRYPGLPSHPTHAIAAAQLAGFGSILSFDVRGGGDAADRVCAGVHVVRHATSLGAVESTIERRSIIPGQEHLPAGLLRMSAGIEDVEDLWGDLDRALPA